MTSTEPSGSDVMVACHCALKPEHVLCDPGRLSGVAVLHDAALTQDLAFDLGRGDRDATAGSLCSLTENLAA